MVYQPFNNRETVYNILLTDKDYSVVSFCLDHLISVFIFLIVTFLKSSF